MPLRFGEGEVMLCPFVTFVLDELIGWYVSRFFIPPENEPPPYTEEGAGRFPEPVWTVWRGEESLFLAATYVIQLVA